MDMKNKIVYHNGDKVKLTGETEKLHGAEWFIGTFLEGRKKGKEALLPVDRYKDR